MSSTDSSKGNALEYKRSNFVTRLPVDHLYAPSHAWASLQEDGTWRVGLTKFATRMLGEIVDHGFQVEHGASVHAGDVIGWIEGFKAISDIYCIVDGHFRGGNEALGDKPDLVNDDPYGAGWLYRADGQPGAQCMDVTAYAALLDKTIDRIIEKEAQERP